MNYVFFNFLFAEHDNLVCFLLAFSSTSFIFSFLAVRGEATSLLSLIPITLTIGANGQGNSFSILCHKKFIISNQGEPHYAETYHDY